MTDTSVGHWSDLFEKPHSVEVSVQAFDQVTSVPGLSVNGIGRFTFKWIKDDVMHQIDVTEKIDALVKEIAKDVV